MKNFIGIAFLLLLVSCGEGKTEILGETAWQKKMNAEFKDATTSPLKDKDRKRFNGLDFFTFDSTFVVTADFERTPDAKPFKMKTTTDRRPEYVQYGIATFVLEGKEHRLEIYQDLEQLTLNKFDPYLFLPFLDNTNGSSTYGGGRYINLGMPKDSLIDIDFNKAYNPLCAYNEKYSCPIVPRVNYIDVEIKAGVKAFNKD